MLRKLIKYEFKATSRFMLLMYGLLVALSVIMSVGIRFNLDEVMTSISDEFRLGGLIFGILAFMVIMLFVVMNVIVICGMFFYSISRFKNNLLGNEGYLMHTLPVKVRDNLLAKNFVSVIWTILSVVVVVIAYIILFFGISGTDIFKEAIHIFSQVEWGTPYVGEVLIILVEFAVLAVVTLINTYFHIYASMAVGYSFNTHRAAKSIAAFILADIACNMFEVMLVSQFAAFGVDMNDMLRNPHVTVWYGIFITAVTTLIYYCVTHYFMSKKLNLQ